MLVPVHSYDASGGFAILNGAPAKSGHVLEIDQWATHLATGAHPMTPRLFLTSNDETHTSGAAVGLITTTESWSDYVTIPMLVPACCNFVTFGVIVTGKGLVRVKGSQMAAAALLPAQGKNLTGSGEAAAANRVQVWCDVLSGETAADENKPIDLVLSGTTGNLVPRRLEFKVAWRKKAHDFSIHALLFDYWKLRADTDLTTFVDTTGGFAP
jgi:hypothetical protein